MAQIAQKVKAPFELRRNKKRFENAVIRSIYIQIFGLVHFSGFEWTAYLRVEITNAVQEEAERLS